MTELEEKLASALKPFTFFPQNHFVADQPSGPDKWSDGKDGEVSSALICDSDVQAARQAYRDYKLST